MSAPVSDFGDRRGVSFQQIVDGFLRDDGLPFASVLSAERIMRVFAKHAGLFGFTGVYSTATVLWAFLNQVLSDGKAAACQAAVANISAHCLFLGKVAPTSDTGDYCRARAKLSEPAIRQLGHDVAEELEQQADESWLWKGRTPKLIDGFTFTMPDTEKNQAEYPQNPAQKPGLGFPIARAVAVISLTTACVIDAAMGPYAGKQTGETSLLRRLLGVFGPQRPKWMDQATYDSIPETIELRELRFNIVESGRRTKVLTVVTTLTDVDEFTKEDIAELYGFRWHVELDIRSIKQNLNVNHFRCKSPEMIRTEFRTTLLAYNLIRSVSATAALLADVKPRQISFTGTCQYVLSAWMVLSLGHSPARGLEPYCRDVLKLIAQCEVGHRPGRLEPRVIKRRRHNYKLMMKPREILRAELRKHGT